MVVVVVVQRGYSGVQMGYTGGTVGVGTIYGYGSDFYCLCKMHRSDTASLTLAREQGFNTILRSDSWSTKKMAAIMSPGARVAQEPQNIEDDVIGCACAVMGLEY